jgi:ABC-type amino acid transport substrate-binding protein
MRGSRLISRKTQRVWQTLWVLVWLLLAACNGRSDSWQRIQESGVLRVGLDPTFPPFELDDGLGLHGLDVDLARAIGAELGLEVVFVYFGYDGLYDALATDQVDVLISALAVDPTRTRDFAYSEPYFNAGQILLVREGETAVTTLSDLRQRTLAVELGAQGHVEATQLSQRVAGLEVRAYNSGEEAITAVLHAETAAALIDSITGRLFMKENPGLRRLPDPVTVEPYALVVRGENGRLLRELNAALTHLQTTNQLETITTHWLGP